MTTATLVKLAVKRDPSAPMGKPAACHLDCRCGTQIPLPLGHEIVTCAGCGKRFGRNGWELHPENNEE